MFHFLVTATLAVSALLGSPSPDPIDAVFQHTGNDSLGGAFSFALHQRMEGSTLYRFTSDSRNSMHPAKVQVELVSINVGSPKTGLVSSVSLVAIVKCGSSPRIAHHALILVSPDNLDRMVKRALAEMDEHIIEELNLGCRPSTDNEVSAASVDPKREDGDRPISADPHERSATPSSRFHSAADADGSHP